MSDERRFYEAPAGSDTRRSAPAALRNREPIGDVLEQWLPTGGIVLEIASGTGEHAEYLAGRFPALEWQPSDMHPDALASVAARQAGAGLPSFRPPVVIDAGEPEWPIDRADAILSINMVHISPWTSAIGLIDGAARLLSDGAPLILYGPWLSDKVTTAPSNLAFDADLKHRDSNWGLRRVEDFAEAARARNLELVETKYMPANNMMLLFRKHAPAR
jgi:hypothetical protein